jgi:AAA15 family ATPase/GTPase
MANYLAKKWYLESTNGEPLEDWKIKPNPLWLDNLSKVNIFVGPNNSGKSRFLRYLLSLENENISPTFIDLDKLLELIIEIRRILESKFTNIPPHDNISYRLFPEYFYDARLTKSYIQINKGDTINIDHFIQSLVMVFKSADRSQIYKRLGMRSREFDIDQVIINLMPQMNEAIQRLMEFKGQFREGAKLKKIIYSRTSGP